MKLCQLELVGARPAEQSELPLARRTMTTVIVAGPNSGSGYSAAEFSTALVYSGAGHSGAGHSGAGPARTPLPETKRPSEPVPIWLAVLLATPCEARRNGENHAVRWNWVSGRAHYTNAGGEAEHIVPLGVNLMGGHTVAVCWMPGETTYTVEVYRQAERCA